MLNFKYKLCDVYLEVFEINKYEHVEIMYPGLNVTTTNASLLKLQF